MNLLQLFKHKLVGYGTDDSPYKKWYLNYLAKRAKNKNWKGVWSNGQARPWIGKDSRLVSDAEFREIIKQNMEKL